MTHDMFPLIHLIAPMISPRPGHRLVFGFDMLMDEDRLRRACPSAVFVITAQLLSRRFIFNGDGLAAPIPSQGSVVHGVVWELPEEERDHLEWLLHVPVRLDRYGAFARGPDHEMIPVEYYAPRDRRPSRAVDPIDIVELLALAHHHGFPDSYLEELARWAPSSRSLRLVE